MNSARRQPPVSESTKRGSHYKSSYLTRIEHKTQLRVPATKEMRGALLDLENWSTSSSWFPGPVVTKAKRSATTNPIHNASTK